MFKRLLPLSMLVVIALGLLAPAMSQAQGGVTVTPNRDYINVRLWPAIGATVIGSMGPGDVATATGRSVDGEWIRIDFHGSEGWVGAIVVTVSGDVNSLPQADPRNIPYNSNTVPNAGAGDATSAIIARLEDSGVYLRAGPSTAYPVIGNVPRYAELPVTGRTENAAWVQVTWEGLIGWAAIENLTLISPTGLSVNNLPVIGPAADTGVRLSDANARFRFLVVDEIRRYLDQANANLGIIETAWQSALVSGQAPVVCSSPPAPEDFWLTTVERANYPDLAEAVDRLNQGLNDLRNTTQIWLDGCLTGGFTAQDIADGRGIASSARIAFDDVQFRITRSRAVIITGIHAHINYAQDQFERIEAIWLDVRNAFAGSGGLPPCVNLPEQPPNFALTSWESGAYPDLVPLVNRLNDGLAVLRQAIQLWQNECNAFNANPGYTIPLANSTNGYNTMLQSRTVLNEVRDVYLNNAYAGGFVVPAPTPTPNPIIATILHPAFTPTFTLTPTPGFSFNYSQAFLVSNAVHAPCTWFAVGGVVLDGAGNHLTGVIVRLVGGGQDVTVTSGSNTAYGISGWEIPLRVDVAQANPYTLRIEDGYGNPLSPNLTIRFNDDCALNTALVTFVQFRPVIP